MAARDFDVADEREHQVMGVAARSALNTNFVTGIVLSLVLLALGWIAFALIMLVVAVIPHLVFVARAGRDKVDVHIIAHRQHKNAWRKLFLVFFVFIVLLSGIAAYSALTGSPLIPGPLSAEITPVMESFLTGFAVGGLIGGLGGLIATVRATKKASAKLAAEADGDFGDEFE